MAVSDRELELVRRDMRDLRTSVERWQRDHAAEHRETQRSSASNRRWMITTALTLVGLLITVLALLLEVYGRTRG